MEDINKNIIPEPGDDAPIEDVTVPTPKYFTAPGDLGEVTPPKDPILCDTPAFFVPADSDLSMDAEEVEIVESVRNRAVCRMIW